MTKLHTHTQKEEKATDNTDLMNCLHAHQIIFKCDPKNSIFFLTNGGSAVELSQVHFTVP